MSDHILFQFFLFILIGLFSGLCFLYEAYRIQKHKGVVTESRIIFIFMLIISIVQFYNFDRLGADPFLLYAILTIALLLGIFLKFYFGGKEITVYETSKEAIVSLVEEELSNHSIPYEKKASSYDEEIFFNVNIEKVKISIDTGIFGEERKIYKLSFKKWWRSPQIEEVRYEVLEILRQQREGMMFWKEIFLNCIIGVAIILGTSYFAWSMFPKFSTYF